MKAFLAVVLGASILTTGCGGSSSETLTAPTASPSIIETFAGTLDAGATKSQNFTVMQTGEVDITLTAVGPPSTIFVGLGVGVPNDTACVLIQGFSGSTQASSTPQIVGVANPGPLCVSIYDVGNLSASVDFSITIAHP